MRFSFYLFLLLSVFNVSVAYSVSPRTSLFCARLLGTDLSKGGLASTEIETLVYQKLDSKVRSGWLLRGIPRENSETVLQHSRKVRKATRIYSPNIQGLDGYKAAMMGLIHDLAEFEAPDFTPHDKIEPIAKHKIEKAAIEMIVSQGGAWANEIMDLWLEYEEGNSEEAKLVHQLDKLDAGIQAISYARQGYDVAEFYSYTLGKLKDPVLIKIYRILLKEEFPSIDVYYQYYSLLRLNGDYNLFQSLMRRKVQASE